MDLQAKSTKELLALHNAIADTAAGPKTFATRAKLIARIESIAAAKSFNLNACGESGAVLGPDASQTASEQSTEALKLPTKRGSGVGELARVLLMDPVGYPHALIASMVNAQIPGATATDKSVRWYASKMRKDGLNVPPRGKAFPAVMDEKQSVEWLKTVQVVG